MRERIKINANKSLSAKEKSAPHKQKTGFRSQSSHVDRILFLQRTIGNQAVQRQLKSGTLQTKLKIGQPGDKYEQEADRVADAVMRMPEPGVQRQVEPEEEEEMIQAKPLAESIISFVHREAVPEEEEEIQGKLLQREADEEEEEKENMVQAKGEMAVLQLRRLPLKMGLIPSGEGAVRFLSRHKRFSRAVLALVSTM